MPWWASAACFVLLIVGLGLAFVVGRRKGHARLNATVSEAKAEARAELAADLSNRVNVQVDASQHGIAGRDSAAGFAGLFGVGRPADYVGAIDYDHGRGYDDDDGHDAGGHYDELSPDEWATVQRALVGLGEYGAAGAIGASANTHGHGARRGPDSLRVPVDPASQRVTP